MQETGVRFPVKAQNVFRSLIVTNLTHCYMITQFLQEELYGYCAVVGEGKARSQQHCGHVITRRNGNGDVGHVSIVSQRL